MDVGQYLRRERELRGMPLEEVAEVTKITLRNLSAIEEGKFDELPNRVFAKGFVKSYAKTIGLNADDVVLRYEEGIKVEKEDLLLKKGRMSEVVSRSRNLHIDGRIVFIIVAAIVVLLSAIFSLK